ncbi:hypothetical protein AYI68_g8319 [Smittium mucronatum]|uniref:Uncharacterized protein n=1 Tax=Smittium mucronatum TaxID=133383 RepID=A0A1R0GL80_9FUNG|nr:hypothetical protein AYI68_g8319 [Smittium mucronatum]
MHETYRAYKSETCRDGILDKHVQVRDDPISENRTPWYDHIQQGYFNESFNIKDPRHTTRSNKTDKIWEDVAQMLSEIYRKGTSNFGRAITWKINAASTAVAEEQINVEECFIDIDGEPIRRKNTESAILEGPFEKMEWSVVPTGNPRNRDIHRCERGNTPHQVQGATSRFNCIETERNCGPVCSDLLGQYEHSIISKEIRCNYLTQISQHSGTPMGSFPEDEYQASSNVFSISSEPGECTKPSNGNNRMVTFEPERATVQLGRFEEPLLMPVLEPDCTDRSEDVTRADINDFNYTRMVISDFFSGNFKTLDLTATNSQATEVIPDPKSGRSHLTKNRDWTLWHGGSAERLQGKICLQHCN